MVLHGHGRVLGLGDPRGVDELSQARLGGVLEEPLDDYQYQQVRTVLLSLAQLLENLDVGMHSVTSAQKLRDLVVQIDQAIDCAHDDSRKTES